MPRKMLVTRLVGSVVACVVAGPLTPEACGGFDAVPCRCVHRGGLICNFKKNLDVLQKLGLMPGATMKAGELYNLLFERISSAKEICGYGDEIVTVRHRVERLHQRPLWSARKDTREPVCVAN